MIVVPENGTTGEISEKKSLLLQFALFQKKQGFAESTILTRNRQIDVLMKRGADIYNPESVKEVIALQPWVNKRKQNVVDAYSSFLQMLEKTWNPPFYKAVYKIPFIPKESEIDDLIHECGEMTGTYLQLMKETAIRAGEAHKVKWTDIDIESRTARITPEKGSNPRIQPISDNLLNKLAFLHSKDKYEDKNRLFSKNQATLERLFYAQRRRASVKLNNPRILQIHFHTFRHWKATMLYHQTKDIIYVQRFLGHRSIMNTMRYIQYEEAYFKREKEQYICKVVKTVEEAIPLLEKGYKLADEFDGVKVYTIPKSSVV